MITLTVVRLTDWELVSAEQLFSQMTSLERASAWLITVTLSECLAAFAVHYAVIH